MKKIKFLDLYKAYKNLNTPILNLFKKHIKNNEFVFGNSVLNFERNFSKYVGAKYCIAVANGTDALEIALESLNLKNGEVVIPTNTWISGAEAILRNNLKPVFCDINLDDYTICVKDLEKKINKKTKAIMVVHLYGNPANMKTINKIAKKYKLKIIEDCAQAHGSRILKKHVGNFSDIGTFSFFPGKNLGCYGDGGCIITNNHKLNQICKKLRNHGALKKHDHTIIGRNSRLDSIQASILNIKLKSMEKIVKKRNILANLYLNGLKNIKGLYLQKKINFNKNSYHQFVIRTKKRDELKSYLLKNGIESMIHYPRMLNELKIFKKNSKISYLAKANNLGSIILSLPISQEHSVEEIKYIIKKIKIFFKE